MIKLKTHRDGYIVIPALQPAKIPLRHSTAFIEELQAIIKKVEVDSDEWFGWHYRRYRLYLRGPYRLTMDNERISTTGTSQVIVTQEMDGDISDDNTLNMPLWIPKGEIVGLRNYIKSSIINIGGSGIGSHFNTQIPYCCIMNYLDNLLCTES